MKRFVVRNYGPSRQLPVGGQQVCVVNDGIIETDNEAEAAALGAFEQITVTDRGSGIAPTSSPDANHEEKHEENHDDSVDEPEDESYEDMNLDELQAIAKDREIPTAGLDEAQLIWALVKYDETPDEPESSETDESSETIESPETTEPSNTSDESAETVDEKLPWKIGDKVSVIFNDDSYKGEIKSVNRSKKTARVEFEDDAVEVVEFDELTRVAEVV